MSSIDQLLAHLKTVECPEDMYVYTEYKGYNMDVPKFIEIEGVTIPVARHTDDGSVHLFQVPKGAKAIHDLGKLLRDTFKAHKVTRSPSPISAPTQNIACAETCQYRHILAHLGYPSRLPARPASAARRC